MSRQSRQSLDPKAKSVLSLLTEQTQKTLENLRERTLEAFMSGGETVTPKLRSEERTALEKFGRLLDPEIK